MKVSDQINRPEQEETAQHYFSDYGGMYVAEILVPALQQLEDEYNKALKDPEFLAELDELLANFAGRPTPVLKCRNITRNFNADIYLKREDLLHGGAHKTNQVLAQALDQLSEKEIVELDDERKASMVSNLLVVLCSDDSAQPIVNAGSIY